MVPFPQARKPRKRKVQKTGFDPILSEDMILDCLSTAIDNDGVRALSTGSMLSVVGAFDREVLREEFIPTVYSALALHTSMGQIQTLISMQRLMDKGELSVEKMSDAIQTLTTFATQHKLMLKKFVERMSQCAKADETIS